MGVVTALHPTPREGYLPYVHQSFPCGTCAHCLLSFCHALLCLTSPQPFSR